VPRLVSIREISDDYGLSDKTIRRKIKSGELIAYRVGSRLLKLDAEQVEAALLRPTNNDSIAPPVEKMVADWPPLTDEQIDRIAALLRVGSAGAA
jgi:excisionase family DNA binding protein